MALLSSRKMDKSSDKAAASGSEFTFSRTRLGKAKSVSYARLVISGDHTHRTRGRSPGRLWQWTYGARPQTGMYRGPRLFERDRGDFEEDRGPFHNSR